MISLLFIMCSSSMFFLAKYRYHILYSMLWFNLSCIILYVIVISERVFISKLWRKIVHGFHTGKLLRRAKQSSPPPCSLMWWFVSFQEGSNFIKEFKFDPSRSVDFMERIWFRLASTAVCPNSKKTVASSWSFYNLPQFTSWREGVSKSTDHPKRNWE